MDQVGKGSGVLIELTSAKPPALLKTPVPSRLPPHHLSYHARSRLLCDIVTRAPVIIEIHRSMALLFNFRESRS